MAKSRKAILLELLELENESLGSVGKPEIVPEEKHESITAAESNDEEEITDSITKPKPKKKLSEKQMESLKKGQQIRDENARKRKEMAEQKAAEDKKILEQKIVKKAISIKKKEIKRQAALDDVSEDETPIQKIKEIARKVAEPKEVKPAAPPAPTFKFF
jgi:flagellum-specific peptidoglycan hydrolase FlgJ